MPTIAIAMIIAITPATMYIIKSFGVAAFIGAVVTAGVGVAVAGDTRTAVAAAELPYESSPAKVAMILYVPSAGGVQALLNVP